MRSINKISVRLIINIIMILAVLLIFKSLNSSSLPHNQDSLNVAEKEDPTNDPEYSVYIYIPIIAALFGTIAGASITIYFNWKRSRQEYKAIILIFCSEIVTLFDRCITYYEQSTKGEVSYSTLFSFIDSSTLIKFSSVCRDPGILASVIELKAKYLQIQRHVEEASRFAMESNRATTINEKCELSSKAIISQQTALAFFLEIYNEIESQTKVIVEAAIKLYPRIVGVRYSSIFNKAKEKKVKIDKETNLMDPTILKEKQKTN